MLKKLLFLSIILFASPVWASPFLVCDPPTTGQIPTYYKISNLAGFTSNVPKDTTGTYGFKLDISTLVPGTYSNVTAVACVSDPTWGEVCSASSNPLSFTRPGAPGLPSGLKITQ